MDVQPVTAAKRGRPLLPPNRRRSHTLSVRLSPDELDSAYQFAQRCGQPLDGVLRRLLLRMIERASSD